MGPLSHSSKDKKGVGEKGIQSAVMASGFAQIFCAPITEIAEKSEQHAATLRQLSTSLDAGDAPSPLRDTFRETVARKCLLLSNLLTLLSADTSRAVELISQVTERVNENNATLPSLRRTLQALSHTTERSASPIGEQGIASSRRRLSSATERKVLAVTHTVNVISIFVQNAFSTLMTISFNICLHLLEADRNTWKSHLLSVSKRLRETQQCIAVIMQLIRTGISNYENQVVGYSGAANTYRPSRHRTVLLHSHSVSNVNRTNKEDRALEIPSPVASCNYHFAL